MIQYLEIMMTICSVLAIKSGTEENLEKKKELWQYLKKQNLPLFLRLRMGFWDRDATSRQGWKGAFDSGL